MDSQIKSIVSRLDKIISNKFGISNMSTSIQLQNDNFLGDKINFAPRDLLILFYEIEKEFSISIPESDIINGKFDTFNNIVEIIKKQVCV